MGYIVIETHGGAEYSIFVTDADGKILFLIQEKMRYRETNDCQAGIIVELYI